MNIKIIQKKDIKELLRELTSEWEIYVPQKNIGGDILIASLPKKDKELEMALDSIVLEGVDTIISGKDIFSPQLETMLEFKDGNIKETAESSSKLIFGVRSCDLKGMLFADEFFKRNFEDKYYLSRIQNRFLVVIGCLKPPRPTCFCTSTKTGPFADNGFDLQLIATRDYYFVETGSKRGGEFISKHKRFFNDASGNDSNAITQIKAKACGAIELKVDFKKALELMSKDDFVPEETYKRIGERCIYCGACLYTCPTCTCFNVFDNVKDNKGERLRNWDACIFEGYTREASGHNPRKEKWQRTSRRYEHKLKYDYQTTGMSGCIGCGRCLSSCPVNIGISKFIQEITENKKIM
jgi:hypothetical protein